MRYINIENITFTDSNGRKVQVKDLREIPVYETLKIYNLQENEYIDEIITRPEFYGDGNESLTYSVIDHNKETFAESCWTLQNVKVLNIPLIEG